MIDVFEDFLGAPLLPHKIENNYDVVAQLLGEMCDGGSVYNTEPNALREVVEMPGLMGRLFSNVGLPSSAPAIGSSNALKVNLAKSNLNSSPSIPWRRANVRHTSNELYVDIVETLSVILAPSGRPLSAISSGSVAFTSKISGVPDLLLVLSAPGGSSINRGSGIVQTMQLPVFHPCVRLSRWKERPGEFSFVPPDGRFILAGYEVDLLPSSADSDLPPSHGEKLFLPASVDMRTSLGPAGNEFEARLTLNTKFPGAPASSARPGMRQGLSGTSTPSFGFGGSSAGSSNSPIIEAVIVRIPIPSGVRNVTDLRPSRGDANFISWERCIEWRIPTKDGASVDGTATLYGSVVGQLDSALDANENGNDGNTAQVKANPLLGYYDEDSAAAIDSYQETSSPATSKAVVDPTPVAKPRKIEVNKALMPTSVVVSFSVKGWLPSGIKVESLAVDVQKSRGLGDGVKPYKGVKYLTVSKNGVERRISNV